jgi:hypothetical protein
MSKQFILNTYHEDGSFAWSVISVDDLIAKHRSAWERSLRNANYMDQALFDRLVDPSSSHYDGTKTLEEIKLQLIGYLKDINKQLDKAVDTLIAWDENVTDQDYISIEEPH